VANPALGRRCGCPWPNPLLAQLHHLRDTDRRKMLAGARRNLQASRAVFLGFEIGTRVSAPPGRWNEVPRSILELAGQLSALSGGSELWSNGGKPQPRPDYFQGARDLATGRLTSCAFLASHRHLGDPLLLHPAGRRVSGRGPGGPAVRPTPSRSGRKPTTVPESHLLFQLALAPSLLTAATRRKPLAAAEYAPNANRAGLERRDSGAR